MSQRSRAAACAPRAMTKPACKSQMASPFASGFSKHMHPGAKTLMPNCQTCCSKACQQAFCKRSLRAINGSPSRHLSMTMNLMACQGNWTQAERNPDVLQGLLLQAGWIRPFTGDAKAAQAYWPAGTAIGKLNIVMAEGKDPHLVLDRLCCNANALREVPERVQLPHWMCNALSNAPTSSASSSVGHCSDTLRLDAAGLLCGWALQFLHHVYISEARSTRKHFGSTTHHWFHFRFHFQPTSAFISGPFLLPFSAPFPVPFSLPFPLPFPVRFCFHFRVRFRLHFRPVSAVPFTLSFPAVPFPLTFPVPFRISCPTHFHFPFRPISASISDPFPLAFPVHFRFHLRPISASISAFMSGPFPGSFPVHFQFISASISALVSAFLSASISGSFPL